MSAVVECVHGDDPAICPPCQNARLPRPPDPEPATVSGVFTAAFPGRCDACDDWIDPGDEIRRVQFTDGVIAYRHACPTCDVDLP